jgi:predicted restriction endonuclease
LTRRRKSKRSKYPVKGNRPKGYSNSTLDKLWSNAIKEMAGHKCEICGSTDRLEAHHIHRCKHHGVRWDLINGCCLCRSCHCSSDYSAHKNQIWFMLKLIEMRGQEWAHELADNTVNNKDWRDRLVQIKNTLID